MSATRLLLAAMIAVAVAPSDLRAQPAGDVPADHPALTLFRYERREPAAGAAEQEPYYQRRRIDGTTVRYGAAQFPAIARQYAAAVEANPWSAKVWANAPAALDFIATQIEEGAEYMGGREGSNAHPHAHGRRFWSAEPTFTPEDGAGESWGDPIDGTTFFVVEAVNAARAAAFQTAWDRAIGEHRRLLQAPAEERRRLWTENRDRWIQEEAYIKAENLVRTIQLIRDNAQGLNLADNLKLNYGEAFQRYSRWVDDARGSDGQVDFQQVRDSILKNAGRYRDDPNHRGDTYRSRLEKLFAQAMPMP